MCPTGREWPVSLLSTWKAVAFLTWAPGPRAGDWDRAGHGSFVTPPHPPSPWFLWRFACHSSPSFLCLICPSFSTAQSVCARVSPSSTPEFSMKSPDSHSATQNRRGSRRQEAPEVRHLSPGSGSGEVHSFFYVVPEATTTTPFPLWLRRLKSEEEASDLSKFIHVSDKMGQECVSPQCISFFFFLFF